MIVLELDTYISYLKIHWIFSKLKSWKLKFINF